MTTETIELEGELLATLLSDESFLPTQPRALAETGLPIPFVESLLIKIVASMGTSSGRRLADQIGLPFVLLEEVIQSLRARQLLVHAGAAAFNDYYYALTDPVRFVQKDHDAGKKVLQRILGSQSDGNTAHPQTREKGADVKADIAEPHKCSCQNNKCPYDVSHRPQQNDCSRFLSFRQPVSPPVNHKIQQSKQAPCNRNSRQSASLEY